MSFESDQYLLIHNQMNFDELSDDQLTNAYISVRLYADEYGVHKHTVLNWIKAGKLPYIPKRHGKYTRYYIPIDASPPIIRNKAALST